MINVILIEDEKPAARRLQRLLEKNNITAPIMLHSVADAIDWFNNNKHPDLIFLDIQLSDGLSFEIFEHVKVSSAIIFTTAYDEYALKAFKLNSVDYLLKPIDEEELIQAVEKFKTQHYHEPVDKVVENFRKLLDSSSKNEFKKRITAKVGQHIKLFEIADIECFYSENKGTYFYTVNNRNYLLDTNLELLEADLDPDQFFRVSRQFIVNIKAIEDIISYTNSRLQLKLNNFSIQPIIVSREKVKAFKEWLT